MRKLLEHAEVMPQVLQIHIDPLAQNRQLMKFSQEEGIQVGTRTSRWGEAGKNKPVGKWRKELIKFSQEGGIQVNSGLGTVPRSAEGLTFNEVPWGASVSPAQQR
eukprot:scaffold82581_cov19-Tisochrysis_lutea.AAC.2